MNEASAERRRDYIPYPTNRVLGSVGDDGHVQAAVAALVEAGFDRKDIDILHGEQDLERLDPAGAKQGFVTQFRRTLTRTFAGFEEFSHLKQDLDEVRAGRFVIMVAAKRPAQRMAAADILNRHGAKFVEFYGRWAWEDLSAPAPTSPQDIPALFARAWNRHDADALAALFDKDAEFVNVTGLWCHDREAIRNAHANGQEQIFNKSTLATDATSVKLLSPEIAVVHARMTLCGDGHSGAAADIAPRSTIVSFVVHKVAQRWLCASAHTSDALPH
jgi:uncharacterized protein (TIGR02246 family)